LLARFGDYLRRRTEAKAEGDLFKRSA